MFRTWYRFLSFSFFLIFAHSFVIACPSHDLWDAILKVNVDSDGFVDYEGIRNNKGSSLNEYLGILEKADLSKCSENEKLAFWINAYNAHTIQQILQRPKIKKVSDDFSLFDQKVKIAGISVSLNEIENRVIRSDKKKGGPLPGVSFRRLDPRIHFALVCAAIDCPKLLNRAYGGTDLELVLQKNAVAFANNPKHLRFEKNNLVLSTLLKWYAVDFQQVGGIPAYLISLTDKNLRSDADQIDARLKLDFPNKVSYKYNWTLNSIANKNMPEER